MNPIEFIVNQMIPEKRQALLERLGIFVAPKPVKKAPIRNNCKITLEKIERALELRKAGVVWRLVGEELGHDPKTIRHAIATRYEKLKQSASRRPI